MTSDTRKRIGIFGGTFDPPHEGHMAIARAVLEKGMADEVWFMVSPRNPFKVDRHLSADLDRLAMTRLAVASSPLLKDALGQIFPNIKVSDFEFQLPQPSYTYNTLIRLSCSNPHLQFIPVVGGDNLEAFGRWRNAKEILHEFGLIVYPRPGTSTHVSADFGPYIHVLDDVTLTEVSSTNIRRYLADAAVSPVEPATMLKTTLPGGLTEEVAKYALSHKLYQNK